MSRRIVAALLAAALACAALAGCQSRRQKQQPPQEQGQAPSQEETAPEQPPASPEPPPQPTPGEEGVTPPQQPSQEEQKENPSSLPEEKAPQPSRTGQGGEPEEPTSQAAAADLSRLAALDGEKKGWGPGGPVDEHNRSCGAMDHQEIYGRYDADFIAQDSNKIYLTFDEGYENGYTQAILDVLKEKQAPAVFFVTQPYVEQNPHLIRRMIDEGHVVGNHSVNHPSFPDTPLEECQEEILGLHRYMEENFGYSMSLFRFPMGEFSEQSLKLVQELGYRSVFWSFAYRDWLVEDQPDPAQALETIRAKSHPGGIYLLHAVSSTNAQILGDLIDGWRAEGYELCRYGES